MTRFGVRKGRSPFGKHLSEQSIFFADKLAHVPLRLGKLARPRPPSMQNPGPMSVHEIGVCLLDHRKTNLKALVTFEKYPSGSAFLRVSRCGSKRRTTARLMSKKLWGDATFCWLKGNRKETNHFLGSFLLVPIFRKPILLSGAQGVTFRVWK